MSNEIVPATAAGLPKLRRRMERAVERLIAALDALDSEAEDLEEGGDVEPTLGSIGNTISHPSYPQTLWSQGGDTGEREVEDEHGGDIQDESHDADVDEPSLGAPENPYDQTRWGQGSSSDDDEEGEDGLPPSYLPVENSRANQAVAARAGRQALALSERKRGMGPTQIGNIGPLAPIFSLVP